MKRRIKRSHFDNMDAMRFVAFLVIFLSSAFYTTDPLTRESNFYVHLGEFMANIAQVGMSLAFILTSFLNTWAVFEERFVYKKLNLIRFYMRRLLTLVPLYFLIFILGYFLLPKFNLDLSSDQLPLVSPAYYLTFLTNFSNFNIQEPVSAVLGNMWSIAIQIQFLIFWPLLLRLFRRNEKTLLIIVGLIFIISAYFGGNKSNFRFSTFNIFCDIAIGGYLAYFSFFKIKLYQKLKAVPPRTIGTIYIAFFASFFFYKQIWTNHYDISNEIVLIVKRVVYGLMLAFFIFEQNFANKSVFKLTKLRVFDAPGRMVYSLYAYHAIGIIAAIKISEFMGFRPSITSYIIIPMLGLLITFIAAAFSYEFYEKKFIRMKKDYQPSREYTPVMLSNEDKTKST
jgi:peptidoglycan/LPS O-acetylase OafA/YrhL